MAVLRLKPPLASSLNCLRPHNYPLPRLALSFQHTSLPPRSFSTSPLRRSTSAPTAPPSPRPSPSHDTPLDWATFFRLRLVRRRFNVFGSVVTAAGGLVGTAFFISSEPTIAGLQVMTLDPMVLGIITFAGGALGWVVGPTVGSPLFNLAYRRMATQMAKKDKMLYEKIKRFRVDPSAQSVINPVPDYYGEKIGSVSGYRQWLKDQRAYNKKAGFHK